MECGDILEGNNGYSHFCNRIGSPAALSVIVYGRKITSVDFIIANVAQQSDPDPAIPSRFLGFVATIPFVDQPALQDQASQWVQSNITKVGSGDIETDINNIHFSLSGTSTAMFLEIGNKR